jgi:cytochrome P450
MPARFGSGLMGLVGFRLGAHRYLLRQARRQGDMASFQLGSRTAVLVNRPDLIKEVLITRADQFGRGYLMERAKRLLGNGLLTIEGQAHHDQRRMLQPVFAQREVGRGPDLTGPALDAMLSRWETGRAFDVLPAVERLTMEVIARYLFGTDLGADETAIRDDLALLGRWFPLLSLPGGRRLERFPLVRSASAALARFDATIHRRVAESQGQSSCLARMGASLEPTTVRDHVVTMFLAGFDTTAASLAWTLYLLSTHPAVAQRVRDDPAFAYEVVQESLRLYPPIVRMGRRALDDMVIGGHFVAKGSVVRQSVRYPPRPALVPRP